TERADWKYFSVLLNLESTLAHLPCLALASCSRFINSSGPVLLDPTVSSLIISEPSSASIQDCLLSCWSRRCAAVSLLRASRVCQLLFVEDASRTAGPPRSHAWRSLGSEAGAEVWKAVDIDSVIESRRLNITHELELGPQRLHPAADSRADRLLPNRGPGRCRRLQQLRRHSWRPRSLDVSGRFNLTAGVRLSIVVVRPADQPSTATAEEAAAAAASCSSAASAVAFWSPREAAALPARRASTAQTPSSTSNTAASAAPMAARLQRPQQDPGNSHHGGCGAGWLGGPENARLSPGDGDGELAPLKAGLAASPALETLASAASAEAVAPAAATAKKARAVLAAASAEVARVS
uniref:Apple domain-containing protein n=1 Tax=Macrostomum lignano TaxID=282301 RepID=A0A1I8FTX7_9PLAT